MVLWTEKYAPSALREVYGNSEAKETIRAWALDWQRGKKGKPLLLHGPPGVGKTATARALAQEMGWSLLETNASDLRDADNIKKLVGLASATGSLFGSLRLVLVDEVDVAFDRGQVPELTRIVNEATQPIVLTANDVWNPKITPVRALCTRIEFKKVSKVEVRRSIERVASLEGVSFQDELIEKAGGDVRSAITDLQAGGSSEREREQNIFEGIRRVFKAKSFDIALKAQDESAVDLDLFIRWIEENIPIEYENDEDVARALDWLSKAETFSGRIRKRQNYALLKFVRALALGGVAVSKKQAYHKFTPYQFPSYVRLLGQTKKNRALLQSALEKAASKLHCSKNKLKMGAWNYQAAYASFFEFTDEEASVVASLNELVHNHAQRNQQQKPKQVR